MENSNQTHNLSSASVSDQDIAKLKDLTAAALNDTTPTILDATRAYLEAANETQKKRVAELTEEIEMLKTADKAEAKIDDMQNLDAVRKTLS